MSADTRSDEFVALGHVGSDHYAGLETFPNPGVAQVEMTSDELTAVCPITKQPDLYTATIEYRPRALCLESKSLKLYLGRVRPNARHVLPVGCQNSDSRLQKRLIPPMVTRVYAPRTGARLYGSKSRPPNRNIVNAPHTVRTVTRGPAIS